MGGFGNQNSQTFKHSQARLVHTLAQRKHLHMFEEEGSLNMSEHGKLTSSCSRACRLHVDLQTSSEIFRGRFGADRNAAAFPALDTLDS